PALLRMQHELLHAQIADLANVQRIFVAAVDGIDSSELLRQLAGLAEFASHGSVQAHLVDFAVAVNVGWRIGIRDVQELISSLGHANRLRVSDIGEGRFEGSAIIENLYAFVSAVRGINISL